MAKDKASFAFNPEIWRSFKSKCVMENKRYTDVLEELMKKWVKS